MKTITSLLALLLVSSLTCLGGQATSQSCCPKSSDAGWLASPFMSYLNPQGGGSGDDGIGGGVLIETALNSNLNVGVSLEGNSGPNNQFAALANVSYSFPELTLFGVVTPYVTAAGGYQYLGEDGALVRTGAGLKASLTENLDLFSDWQYGWDSNGGDQQIVRLGVTFQF